MGKVGGESGLEKQEITSVIRKNLGSVRGCYVALPQKTPKAAGKTVMKWNILKTGKVGDTGIKMSSISDKDFRECMVEKVSSWEFPKHSAKEPVKITYPFMFSLD